MRYKTWSAIILILAAVTGYFVYSTEKSEGRFAFKYGLDLRGGSHLVYQADTSEIAPENVSDAMESLRSVIEKRVNLFGVSEAIVQIENAGAFGTGEGRRLIVELPGVTDLDEAIQLIGKTPLLEFKLITNDAIERVSLGEVAFEELEDTDYVETGLTGKYLERASLSFDQVTREPMVLIDFNEEGSELFKHITANNVGRVLAIYLDGELKQTPFIREEIPNGQAQISGGFTPEEARTAVRDLNLGALPVPIELVSTQNIGATLGMEALSSGVRAGLIGIVLVMLFMTFYYRLPGLVSSVSLTIYIIMMLAIFKLIPVTLTAAGIAGFILSVGMAVDANILIFERMKDELQKGEGFGEAVRHGFLRAWLSIRDGNISTILSAIVLFWLGTAAVEGFALTLSIGVLVSMFTAITLTRTLLLAIVPTQRNSITDFLYKAK